MAALAANPLSVLPPSWDETIVPSLRKRLESESRILSKRLSTISITDEGPPSDHPQVTHPKVSPPQYHTGDIFDPTGFYSQRPSAIPRPSFTRTSERAAGSPSPPPPTGELPRKQGSKRQRTQSTPFPFNPPPSGSIHLNGDAANGIPIPSSSGTMSTRVQSPPLGRTTPSRIPTVSSRVRSGSQSSQGFGSLNGGKASLPPSHKFSPSETTSIDSESQYHSLRVKGSSSSLARQRIVDERPPFTNDLSPGVLESEFTGRPSADEERPYQHWYRGDVSRNGGVGEYRVGKRMEMLDIANFGHAFRGPVGRTRPYEEPAPHSDNIAATPRKRAESVSSRERASIYIDPQDETVTSRVMDEMPLTDIDAEDTDYERDPYHYSYDPPTEFGVQHEHSQILPTNHNRLVVETPFILPTKIPPSNSQTRIPQPQLRSIIQKHTITAVPSSATSEPSNSVKGNHGERGRVPSANTRAKLAKEKGQKRSKSAADALRTPSDTHESSDYADLTDAVPETYSPLPRNGNWDEVVLPTVARRMGIEYEKEDSVTAAKRKARESRVAPAPGTFGYDHTKYKPPKSDEDIPMGEFGQRDASPHRSEDGEQQSTSVPSTGPPDESMSRPLRSRRETMPSPAPFAHYAPQANQLLVSEGRNRRKERQDVPQILVSPPTVDIGSDKGVVEKGEGAGCCKCVVM